MQPINHSPRISWDTAIDIFLTGEADVISFNMLEEDIRIMRSSFGHPRYYRTSPRVPGKYVQKKVGLKRSGSEDVFRPSQSR
jgi:hypothetical protein